MPLRLKANRRFPSIPVVVDTAENHTQVLMAVKEALDIGQRRTGDLMNSFIRVQDLIDLGLITIEGNTQAIVGADLSEIANIGDLSGAAAGDFLRFDGSVWANDQLSPADITQTMVTQHEAALDIDWSQVSGAPVIPTVISDMTDVDVSAPVAEQVLVWDGSNWENQTRFRRPIGATWVSASALSVPINDVSVYCPTDGYIERVVVLADSSTGSCVIDIWKDVIGSYPPTVGDSICGGNKPTISSGRTYQDATLTGWTRNISAGDVLRFHLDSTATFSTIHVFLAIR